jgi:hypothetical protein
MEKGGSQMRSRLRSSVQKEMTQSISAPSHFAATNVHPVSLRT